LISQRDKHRLQAVCMRVPPKLCKLGLHPGSFAKNPVEIASRGHATLLC
jgi:hypothetical protein